jgi:hypothetical protein
LCVLIKYSVFFVHLSSTFQRLPVKESQFYRVFCLNQNAVIDRGLRVNGRLYWPE